MGHTQQDDAALCVFDGKDGELRLHGMIWQALLQLPMGLWKRMKGNQADITPQSEVNISAFMGRWYEQARLDNAFEHGMDEVYSVYEAVGDGRFRVCNNGTDAKGRNHQAHGMGSMKDAATPGALQVSFVPPYGWFAAPFLVLYTDSRYREALIAGSGGHYLWLLTREQHPDSSRIHRLLAEARRRGFNTRELRRTRQGYQNRQSTPTET